MLELCQQERIPFICYFPLGRGDLGTWSSGLGRIAARHRATSAQIALAWLLHRSPVTLPIPGTSSPLHLEENVAAAGIALSEEDMVALSRYRPTGVVAILAPGIFAALSLAIPPRARSMGFSVASLWVIPGLIVLPVIGVSAWSRRRADGCRGASAMRSSRS